MSLAGESNHPLPFEPVDKFLSEPKVFDLNSLDRCRCAWDATPIPTQRRRVRVSVGVADVERIADRGAVGF
jgi:hypothetical protein